MNSGPAGRLPGMETERVAASTTIDAAPRRGSRCWPTRPPAPTPTAPAECAGPWTANAHRRRPSVPHYIRDALNVVLKKRFPLPRSDVADDTRFFGQLPLKQAIRWASMCRCPPRDLAENGQATSSTGPGSTTTDLRPCGSVVSWKFTFRGYWAAELPQRSCRDNDWASGVERTKGATLRTCRPCGASGSRTESPLHV